MYRRGDAASALAELSGQYADGADPMAVLRDLAEITHWISVIKINPQAAEDPTTPPDEQARGGLHRGELLATVGGPAAHARRDVDDQDDVGVDVLWREVKAVDDERRRS